MVGCFKRYKAQVQLSHSVWLMVVLQGVDLESIFTGFLLSL